MCWFRPPGSVGAWQALDMSVVKINAIEVPPGKGEELEARFAARAGMVDQQPGFEEFMLLRPVAGDDRYFVVTRWDSEEAFENWRNGQAFQHQHRETHDDEGTLSRRSNGSCGGGGGLGCTDWIFWLTFSGRGNRKFISVVVGGCGGRRR